MEKAKQKNKKSFKDNRIQNDISYANKFFGSERKNSVYQQRISSQTYPTCIYGRWRKADTFRLLTQSTPTPF